MLYLNNRKLRKYGNKALHFGKNIVGLKKNKEKSSNDTEMPDASQANDDTDAPTA